MKKILLKRNIVKFILAAVFCLTGHRAFSQSEFIKKFRPLADSLEQEYGIPSAVILGVAVIESGAGKSRNTRLLNNYFGIVGKNNLHKTKGIKTKYKQYPDARASFVDFCKLITRKKFYSKLKGNKNYLLWTDAISKSGYSEVPAIWKQRVNQAIRRLKLSET
ncbi:MAG: glucosaminidase domain-containing protein [Chitinophagaceae bacterium]|nr:glucosaminidase domain-containing protein [Chitinophagaceae bacterium]